MSYGDAYVPLSCGGHFNFKEIASHFGKYALFAFWRRDGRHHSEEFLLYISSSHLEKLELDKQEKTRMSDRVESYRGVSSQVSSD